VSPAPSGPSWLGPEPGDDSWLDLHWSGRRLELPFDQHHNDARNTESFVHWYKIQEDEANHSKQLFTDDVKPTIMPWSQERDLALQALRRTEQGGGRYIRLQGRSELFGHLAERNPAKGTEALAEALVWKLGGFEDACRYLDIGGTGQLGLMEFVGCLSVLGLDTNFLCGMDEFSVFRRVDWHDTGVVQVRDLLRRYRGKKVLAKFAMMTPAKASSKIAEQTVAKSLPPNPTRWVAAGDEDVETRLAVVRWMAVAKWMAAAQQRSAAIRSDRLRHGWKSVPKDGETQEPAVAPDSQMPSSPQGSLPRARTASDVTKESAVAMREQEYAIRGSFSRMSSISLPDGSMLMNKSDLWTFFSDLQLADPERHKLVSGPLIDKLYDEAIELQCGLTKIGTGLTFWSFKVVLNNIIGLLGFRWESLVERTMQLGDT